MNGAGRLIAVLAAVACAVVAGAQPAGMTRLRGRHYEVITDLARHEAEPIAAHMDLVFDEFERRFAAFPMRGPKSYPLYVFATRDGYVQHLRSEGINGANTGGMFFRTGEGAGLATFAEQPRLHLLQTLQHEGFHHFAYMRIGPDLPAWVNEGLAEYFGEAFVARNRFMLGRAGQARVSRVKAALEKEQLLPFGEILHLNAAEWADRITAGDTRSRMMYDESWSIVHFLIDGDKGKHQDRFVAYLRALGSGLQHKQAFARAFGADQEAEFEAAWKQHIQRLEPDPLSTAMVRLSFLAEGLGRLHEGRQTPGTFEELRRKLQEGGFKTVQMAHGGYVALSAEDPDMFSLPPEKPGALAGTPEMLASTGGDLPPGLKARVGRATLSVAWERSRSGELGFTVQVE